MTDPTQAEVPAGMKAYGPAHPDYPNAPKDWNGGPVLLRNGATSHNAQRWSVGYPADLCNHPTGTDIIAYTPSTSVQGAGDATPPAPTSVADEATTKLIARLGVEHCYLAPSDVAEARRLLAFAPRPAGEGEKNSRATLAVILGLTEQKVGTKADFRTALDVIGSFARRELGVPEPRAALATEGTPS
jgi:hypothetical protein